MTHRPTFTDKAGKRRKAKRWYASFRDLAGRQRRVPTYTLRRAAERFETNVRRLVELRRMGELPEGDLATWLDTLDDELRGRLVEFGLVDGSRSAAARTVEAHVDLFEQHLRARGTTPAHVASQTARVRRVLDAAGAVVLADLRRLDDVRRALGRVAQGKTKDGKPTPPSTRTLNGFRQALGQFGRWLVEEGHMEADPFARLETTKGGEKRVRRRALSEQEIGRLLAAAASGPLWRGAVTGETRALAYRLILEVGLRRNELLQLTRGDLDFEELTLTVRSRYSKNRREAVLPLRLATARKLAEHVGPALPAARVFAALTPSENTAEMLRFDLETAGIEAETPDGRVDLHALRHTFVTRLARSGAHVSVAQALARHSSPTLTLAVYTHVERSEATAAVESLPSLDAEAAS